MTLTLLEKYGRPKWYKYYNCKKAPESQVLLQSTTVYSDNIVIARRIGQQWSFTKFLSLDHFMDMFNQCSLDEKSFYVTLRSPIRYLYVDVDYALSQPISTSTKRQLISTIKHNLSKFVEMYGNKFTVKCSNAKWLIWDATRDDKFSLHLVNINYIMHYKEIKHFVDDFQQYLCQNGILHHQCKIDTSVYGKDYQLWRLPENHNGNPRTILRLYNESLSLRKQFKYNIMNNVKLSTKYIPTIQPHTRAIKPCKSNPVEIQYNNIDIQPKILDALVQIFNTECIYKGKKQEYIIRQHFCPVAKRKHKSNTGRLSIKNIHTYENSYYCIFRCMSSECEAKQKGFIYLSLSSELKRPWLFHELSILTAMDIKDVDLFIDLLLKHHLAYKKNTEFKQFIIKTGQKIRFNHSQQKFSTFFSDNIIHKRCGTDCIQISYKETHHPLAFFGQATFFCHRCKMYINLKNQQLYGSDIDMNL